jgi:hypothetical protein
LGAGTGGVKAGARKTIAANGILEVTNLLGNNTTLRIESGTTTLHTHIDQLRIQNFLKTPYDAISLNGFEATGRTLQLIKTPMYLSTGSYRLHSDKASEVQALLFSSNASDSVMAQVPHMRFNVQFADLLKGRLPLQRCNGTATPTFQLKPCTMKNGAGSRCCRTWLLRF